MRDSEWRKMTNKGISRGRKNVTFVILSLIIASLGITATAAPSEINTRTTRHKETLTSSSSTKRGLSEEVGNPSELAWQAWLLVDGNTNPQNSGILDSASLLRRITPKSIFIAPALTACAEGYQADTMNRCIKDVSIDKQAHHGFLVERLNAIFANVAKPQFSQSSSSSSSSSSPTGPLQLNIPLLMPEAPKPLQENPFNDQNNKKNEHEEETSSSVEDIKKIPQEQYLNDDRVSHDAIVTVYEFDEASKEKDNGLPLKNKSIECIVGENKKINSTKSDESIGDSLENIDSMINYDVPADKIVNSSHTSANSNSRDDKDDTRESIEVSPTLVLLLSPTKLPSSSLPGKNGVIVAHNSSLGRVIIKVENVTGNMTGKEIIRVSVPDSLSQSTPTTNSGNDMKNPSNDKEAHDTVTTSGGKIEDSPIIDEYDQQITGDETTEIYDDDDENYDDEILKHSEAGITVTVASNDNKTNIKNSMTELLENFGNSSDKEAMEGGEITGEVSVNRDFVRETTLVDFPPDKVRNSSTSVIIVAETNNRGATRNNSDSENLELPVIGISSLDNLKNEKRGDHLSNAEGFVGDLVDDEKVGKVESVIDDVRHENKNVHVDTSTMVNSAPNSSPNKNFSSDSKESIINPETLSNLNKSSNVHTSSIDDSDVNTKPEDKAESTATDDLDINKAEVIYPVRGIEEAFEDSLPVIGSSSTEKSEGDDTMMVASTNIAGTIITQEAPTFPASSEKHYLKPTGSSNETENTKIPSKPIAAPSIIDGIYDYDIPSRDYSSNREKFHGIREHNVSPIIRTIEEERYQPEPNYDLPSASGIFPPSERNENYVRFPNYEVRQENRVRFPSDEANSISNDYKERNRRPYANRDEQIYNGGQHSTGVNLLPDGHRKESYWWLPNEWRNDQSQKSDTFTDRSRSTADQRTRDRSPMLLRFWTRMPLVRDPSLSYPTRSGPVEQYHRADSRLDVKSTLPTIGQSRRPNYYRDISNHDISRTFARNRSAMGG